MKNKATLDDLHGLHSMVARELAGNLDDPKVLSLAIKFLKDNDVTADFIESESMMSITDSIRQIAQDTTSSQMLTVEDMLGIGIN